MELGAFSVSLAVKDLQVSLSFYTKLGFEIVGGDPSENWVILANGGATIGLFEGMFEDNILTFNPGLSQSLEQLETFAGVRKIQDQLDSAGVSISLRVESGEGPGHIALQDPDGNQILIDQHK